MNHHSIPVLPTTTPIVLPELLSRIGVQRPYFAFRKLVATENGTLATRVRPEQPTELEHEAICAAEAGRHLAILGLCAVAQERDDAVRHYYLARRATLTRTAGKLRVPVPARGFYCSARATSIDKRTATARAHLSGNNRERLFDASIEYQVLPEKLFHRMFPPTKAAPNHFPEQPSPYTSASPLRNMTCDGTTLTATLGPLSASSCAGHFPGCPVVPVAILLEALGRAAGQLLSSRLRRPNMPYLVLEAQIEADHLARPTDQIELLITNHRQTQRRHHFTCLATTQANTVGRMELTLYPLGA